MVLRIINVICYVFKDASALLIMHHASDAWAESKTSITGYLEKDIVDSNILPQIETQVSRVMYNLENYTYQNGTVIRCDVDSQSPSSGSSATSCSLHSNVSTVEGIVLEGLILKYFRADFALKNLILLQHTICFIETDDERSARAARYVA